MRVSDTWTITEIPVTEPAAAAILHEYLFDIASRYWGRPATDAEMAEAATEAPNDDLVPPTGAFLLARLPDGTPAGCVGVRVVEPELTELTRMYVRPVGRRQGGARRLVSAAEDVARRIGAKTMRLDTRRDLVEAQALYAQCGYAETPPHNGDKYADHWFSKSLTG